MKSQESGERIHCENDKIALTLLSVARLMTIHRFWYLGENVTSHRLRTLPLKCSGIRWECGLVRRLQPAGTDMLYKDFYTVGICQYSMCRKTKRQSANRRQTQKSTAVLFKVARLSKYLPKQAPRRNLTTKFCRHIAPVNPKRLPS